MPTVLTLLHILRARIVLCLVLSVTLVLAAAAGVYLKRSSFESSARLLLNTDTIPLSLSRAELPAVTGASPTVETMATLVEILTARDLAEALVDDLGVEAFRSPPPSNPLIRAVVNTLSDVSEGLSRLFARVGLVTLLSERDELVEAVQARLIVHPVRQSQVMEVAFRWPTPTVPPLVTERIVDLFLDRVEGLNAPAAEQDVFAQQAQIATEQLATAQANLRALQDEFGIVDASTEILRLSERIARLSQQVPARDGDEARSPEQGSRADDLLRRIAALEIERAGALVLSTDNAPAVREIDRRLEAARAALAREAEATAGALDAERARLSQLLSAEAAFVEAAQAVQTASDAVRTYSQAAADRNVTRLQQERVRIRVIDTPRPPLRALGPSRLVLMVVAVIAALLAAVALTLTIDRLLPRRAATQTTAEEVGDRDLRRVS